MTEQEYKQKEAKIKERNKNITMKRKLHRMKKSRFKFKKIRTSKKVLWTIIVICLEILFFSEYMALKTEDTSFMYALVAIPASLIPTVLSYMKNSRVEHQMGQFENPIETPSVTLDLNNEEENKAAG